MWAPIPPQILIYQCLNIWITKISNLFNNHLLQFFLVILFKGSFSGITFFSVLFLTYLASMKKSLYYLKKEYPWYAITNNKPLIRILCPLLAKVNPFCSILVNRRLNQLICIMNENNDYHIEIKLSIWDYVLLNISC